jgi:hypothetical protein
VVVLLPRSLLPGLGWFWSAVTARILGFGLSPQVLHRRRPERSRTGLDGRITGTDPKHLRGSGHSVES